MKFKKVIIIFLALIVAFTSVYSIPQQKAMANPLALSGGITVGAGTYTLAALGLAGIVGLAGYEEYEQEINAHAMRAWQNGSDLAKTSITMSLEAAKGLGNGLVNLEEPFLNWANTQIDSLAAVINTKTIRDATVHADYVVSYPLERRVSIQFTPESGLTLNGATTPLLNVNANSGGYVQLGYSLRDFSDFPYEMTYDIAIGQLKRVTDLNSMMALAQSWGLDAILEKDGYSPAVYKQRIQESWESMRDAGLVLPVDSAIPHANGNRVTYNPDADTYTGVDGGVINPSDVTWSFPMPRVRTKDVPVPGVYVDTPPLTGVPSIDEAIAKNPAIPKTTTNVNTGVTIANPDIPIEGDVPIEGEVPGGNVPPGSDWSKPPSKKPPNISGLIITKFPFSLPWDFFGILGWLQAEPKAPVFKLDAEMKNPFGKNLSFDSEYSLEVLDPYIGYFRSFILIGFSFFLILATRKLMGGAS